MSQEVTFIIVFANSKVRRYQGELEEGSTIQSVVDALSRDPQAKDLKELRNFDYTPYVDGVQAHECKVLLGVSFITAIKIVSKMPEPTN